MAWREGQSLSQRTEGSEEEMKSPEINTEQLIHNVGAPGRGSRGAQEHLLYSHGAATARGPGGGFGGGGAGVLLWVSDSHALQQELLSFPRKVAHWPDIHIGGV